MTDADVVDPSALRPHPDQERVYGAVGGDHDPHLADLRARIELTRTIQPLVATRATPGLPAGTIVSGHRRWTIARSLGWKVLVQWRDFADATEAKAAFLAFNEQREKDEWVRTQEAEAWREVETARARGRQEQARKRGASGPDDIIRTDHGTARAKVAARLKESEATTRLRLKLADKAREQSPADPAASPVAQELRRGTPVNTVARKFGVGSRQSSGKSQRPGSRPAQARAPAPPRVDERATRVKAVTRLVAELHQRAGELLHDRPLAHVSPDVRSACESEVRALITRLEDLVLAAPVRAAEGG